MLCEVLTRCVGSSQIVALLFAAAVRHHPAMRIVHMRRAGAALSCSRWSVRMARTLTSTPLTTRAPAADDSSATRPWPLVDRLNSTVVDYPMTSFTIYTASSLGTFGVGFALLSAAGFDGESSSGGSTWSSSLASRPPPPRTVARTRSCAATALTATR